MASRFFAFIALIIFPFSSWSQDAAPLSEDSISAMLAQWHALPEAQVESVGLSAGARGLDEVPGALHVIRPAELERYVYTDPLRVLRSVSGVNIQEEDGFGLRPNIGLRGSGAERSARITLMEDGILVAPAPYSAPAAYYFPSIARMASVEVLKGSSQIAFGPQTAGGAINFVTPSLDNKSGVLYRSEVSGFGGRLQHVRVQEGWQNKAGTWSCLVEGMQVGSQGFKILANDAPTGFSKTDWMAKFRWQSPAAARVQQSLEWKTGAVSELSHETYAGLSEADFASDPFQRYAATEADRMEARHRLQVIRHTTKSRRYETQTDIYRLNFERNWYKLDRYVDVGGNKHSLLSVFEAEQTAWLSEDTEAGAQWDLKANNRAYKSRGIQHRGIIRGNSSNQWVYGLRIHQDDVDRFEWRDGYRLVDGNMRLFDAGEAGTAGNRIDGAQAFAGYVRGTIRFGAWTFTPGVRTEQMRFFRTDYGSADLQRTEANPEQRENRVSVWLPGLGVNFAMSETVQCFAGAHRGFIPPGSAPDTEPESSLNVEVGIRQSSRRWSGQLVAFHNTYDRLLGSDLNATGGSGTGDLFNGGSARTRGVECEAAVQLAEFSNGWVVPLRLTYTYTDARFTSDFESDFGPWSVVEAGDYLPYLAPHQGNAQVSIASDTWSTEFNFRYVAAMRTTAGALPMSAAEGTDEAMILDWVVRKSMRHGIQWHAGVNNVFDSVVVVARRPAGLRPGMPRLFRTGIRVAF